MTPSPQLSFILTSAGLLLLWLGYRGIRKKEVLGGSGSPKSTRDVEYYLILTGYLLGGTFFQILAAIQFHKLYGWQGLTLFLLVLIGGVILVLKFRTISRGILNGIKSKFIPKPPPPEPSPKMWALAASSIYAHVHGRTYFELAGRSLTDRAHRSAQRFLKKKWDITDEESFEEVQDWLFEVGHRKEFYEYIEKITTFTDEEREAYIDYLQTGPNPFDKDEALDEAHRIEMISENLTQLQQNGFLAWDYLRFLDNCRVGYVAGYIEEEEAWNKMLSASQILQTRFDSWEDMGNNFLIGRRFWSGIETDKDGHIYEKACEQLLTNEKSPWNKIKWELPLYSRAEE